MSRWTEQQVEAMARAIVRVLGDQMECGTDPDQLPDNRQQVMRYRRWNLPIDENSLPNDPLWKDFREEAISMLDALQAPAELEARVGDLIDALEYVTEVCPPINSQGEEAHARARAVLSAMRKDPGQITG